MRQIERDHTTVDELFEHQATRFPARPAMSFNSEVISYGDLNTRANRLGRVLKRRGVGRDSLVGIGLERGPNLITTLLAVLKTGSAYVPLDPEHPTERLDYIIHDSAVRILICDDSVNGFRERQNAVLFRELEAEMARETGDNLDSSVEPTSLAYVIYTSGSTGRPKGVAVPHSALSNVLTGLISLFRITSEDRWLALTTISFDIAALEWLLPLTLGGQSIVASREEARDPRALMALADRAKATIVQATPWMWRMLLAAASVPRSVRLALCGGEAMPRELARQLMAVPDCEAWNLYGPTETTIWSTAWRLSDPSALEAPPIGRPIRNTKVCVLGDDFVPTRIGEVGELYIGGAGLARGYWSDPALTAQKFIPDPFGTASGDRLYRTGDLVRLRASGDLDFVGRTDSQVKIRGHRIELGELEAALQDMLEVDCATVAVRENVAGVQALAAYVVPIEAGLLTPERIRRRLSGRLPHYMIPDFVLLLPELPLLPNGKLDRGSLPDPFTNLGGGDARNGRVSPRTPTEREVAKVWARVLGVEEIGSDDDFFDLGGHSLLAIQVILGISDSLGVDVTPLQLFEHSTVCMLSQLIDDLKANDSNSTLRHGLEF